VRSEYHDADGFPEGPITLNERHETTAVNVDGVIIGGCAPVVVQAMTDTDTADVEATVGQCLLLAEAGAELVRIAVDTHEAAIAVPEIRRRLHDSGCRAPLVGDFHSNGHLLLRDHPDCARALAKYRINPGNVGKGARRDDNFTTICGIARDNGKAVRVGVNGGSIDPDLVTIKMQENADLSLGRSSQEVLDDCMVISVLESTALARQAGLAEDRIVISCKVSDPPDLIRIYRRLAHETRQPLHLGLTEAGMGTRGLVWSAAAMGVLLADGIGDTIRVSLTPPPDGDRRDEVKAAREILQSLGIRHFSPTVISCPACGRTSSTMFRELAQRIDTHLGDRMPRWRERYEGIGELSVAVMGCRVNGPGESRAADIGISLPGTGETPKCPVYIDGEHATTIQGDFDDLTERFIALIDEYVERRFGNH
jgi:(E)-4-hydroxy-3-methylbut-2-enyl-diphosphate synthase